MTKHCLCFSLFLLLKSPVAVQCIRSHPNSTTNELQRQELQHHCQLVCQIDVIGFLYNEAEKSDGEQSPEKNGDDLFLCRLQDDAFRSRAGYRIALPASFSESHKQELSSEPATICISSGEVDRENYRIHLAEDAEISLMQRRRRLQSFPPIVGTRTILAVQLTTSFAMGNNRYSEDPGMSQTEIEGAMFGTGPNAPGHDLTSQYRACSFGALNLTPASGTNIQNGVAEVRLRKPIAGGEILGSLQDDILEATEARVGSLDQFDHIIYCIPDDALMDGAEKWTAFTYFHSHWSFFQRRRCSAMSVTIHELGHNLGFRHSGFNTEAYGDESGYMGFTVYQSGAPIKCFNGHKNWVSGWFDDRELRVTPSMDTPVLARLVTFVDYNKELGLNDVVLIRVGPYFFQYNRAKGINIDTGMHADKVSITYAPDHLADSYNVGGLSAGESASLPDYRNTGYNLSVEVCEFGSTVASDGTASLAKQVIFGDNSDSSIEYAWVSIHLENGVQRSQCAQVRSFQLLTSQPTAHPTSRPTSSPPATPSPSPRPTLNSLRPTLPPVKPTLNHVPNINTQEKTVVVPEQEQVQKRRPIVATKDMTKLVEDEDEAPMVRRRLKGGR